MTLKLQPSYGFNSNLSGAAVGKLISNPDAVESLAKNCNNTPLLRHVVSVFAKHRRTLLYSDFSEIKRHPELVQAIKTLIFLGIYRNKILSTDIEQLQSSGIGASAIYIPTPQGELQAYALLQIGRKPKSTVVFLHGLWNDTKSFLKSAQEICSQGHGVIIPSYSGHDYNPGIPTEGAIRNDVSSVIKYCMQYSQGVDVIGHSMGAANALLGIRDYFDTHRNGYIGNLVLVSAYKNFEEAVIPTIEYLLGAFNKMSPKYAPCAGLDDVELVLNLLNTPNGNLLLLELFKDEWESDKNLNYILDQHSSRIGKISLKHAEDDPVIFARTVRLDSEIHACPPLAFARPGANLHIQMTSDGRHFAGGLNVAVIERILNPLSIGA